MRFSSGIRGRAVWICRNWSLVSRKNKEVSLQIESQDYILEMEETM